MLASLLPQNPVLLPSALAFVTYGFRFVAFAAIAFYLLDPSRNPRWGKVCIERPAGYDLTQNVRRELRRSFFMLCVITALFTVLYGYGVIASSLLYRTLSDYPLWWFWASIPVMIVLHDTLFYWLHRALHTRLLFERFHRQHHESVFTTAFTSYSFGWGEAFSEGVIVVAILFVVPAHPLAFVIFQTLSIAYNIYGHCGWELFPDSMHAHWLGRWINTASMHAHHHRYSGGNYSFYFTIWDRLLGTLKASPLTPCKK